MVSSPCALSSSVPTTETAA
ncbi:hypothetical protein STRTUCAR8_02047, partial [Streptomyces turgidiscabies Car8]